MLAKTFVGSIIIRGSMTPTNIALHEIPVRGVRPVSIFALLSLYIIIIQNQKIIINTHLKLVNTLAETDTLIIIMLWHRFIYGAINNRQWAKLIILSLILTVWWLHIIIIIVQK